MPEQVQLHLPDGTTYPARLRWRNGDEAEFEFLVGSAADAAARDHLWPAYRAARDADPAKTLQLLQTSGFRGDDELREAAHDAKTAHARLMAVLRQHMLVLPEDDA